MPENEGTNASTFKGSFTTTGANWTVSNDLDIDALYNKAIGKKSKKKKGLKENKQKQIFRCDWCGRDFRATREEVNPEDNGGYYCIDRPECRIEGKYGRSMLSKELFELDEEVKDDVPND